MPQSSAASSVLSSRAPQETQEPEERSAPVAFSLRSEFGGISEAPTPAAVAMLSRFGLLRGKHAIEAFQTTAFVDEDQRSTKSPALTKINAGPAVIRNPATMMQDKTMSDDPARLSASVPRYTCYPPAPRFNPAETRRDWLEALPVGPSLSAYGHIPFDSHDRRKTR